MCGICRMHARSESHFNGTNCQWDEFEGALATANCSRSQSSRTKAKYAGIVTAIILRVNLAAPTVQRMYQNIQLMSIPDENSNLIHTSHSQIQGYTLFSAWLPQDNIINACKSRKIISDLARQIIYLCANCIVGFDKEVFQDWIVSVLYQIF